MKKFFIDQNTKELLLVMEYADSGDLQSYLKTNFNNLSWDNKIDLAFQIAKGLNYLHNENILHKDLISIAFLFILFNNYIYTVLMIFFNLAF